MAGGGVHSGGAGEVQPTGPEDVNLHVEGGVDGWICCEGQHKTDHARLIAKSG